MKSDAAEPLFDAEISYITNLFLVLFTHYAGQYTPTLKKFKRFTLKAADFFNHLAGKRKAIFMIELFLIIGYL